MSGGIYYGCGKSEAGHYAWGGCWRSWAAPSPFDRRYKNGADRLDGGYTPPMGHKQGEARLTHAHGWTVLSCWDNSVDDRPGSHCTFAFEGTHDFDAALALAHEHFAPVIVRQKFKITLALTTEGDPELGPGRVG